MKILVVQIGRIGDTVLTTPLFRAIKQALPDAEIHVLASRTGAPVLVDNPRVKKIIVYRKDPFSLFLLLVRLQFSHYDWLIDPKDHPSTESSFIAGICRAKNKVGYNKPGSGVFIHAIPSNEENYNLHATERNLVCLKPLGFPMFSELRPELFFDRALQEKIRVEVFSGPQKSTLLNISAGHEIRYWTAENWAAVARYCINKGLRSILVHKPRDAHLAQKILELSPGLRIFHSSSIRDIVAIVPLVCCVVTLDTSVVHIASAFDVPQVALFLDVEWNLIKFRPLSGMSAAILPEKGMPVSSIPAGRVIDEVEKMLTTSK
jgi:ADP-heptose:LPS heptosyltransferase